jgi:hypothetical protein
VKRRPYVPPEAESKLSLPPFRYRAPVTVRPSDDLTWLRTTLQAFDVEEERELALKWKSNATSPIGEKWRAEIQLLEDIGYDGCDLDLDDEKDRDTLTRRVDLLRIALDDPEGHDLW